MRITTYGMETPNVLVKEGSTNYPALDRIERPADLAQMMRDVFRLDRRAEEHFFMVAVNTKCRLLGVFEVSHGSVDQSMAGTREVCMRALLAGASAVFVCHNHPSGDESPSKADVKATEELRKAVELVGVKLLDHVIVAGDRFYSFLDGGRLPSRKGA